jgi:hypothetical protein
MAELPTRPIQSLAELQHFEARNNNPIPPFQFNLIGNGSAHPIFAPDQVSVQPSYNNGMCKDGTYILNPLLFDDWSVWPITPEIRDFRNETDPERELRKVYLDRLETTKPLPMAARSRRPVDPLHHSAARLQSATRLGHSRPPVVGCF